MRGLMRINFLKKTMPAIAKVLDANQDHKTAGRLVKPMPCKISNQSRSLTGMKVLYHAGFALLMISPALALSPAEQRGKTFALNNCGRCHSIDKVTPSPLKIAPPF